MPISIATSSRKWASNPWCSTSFQQRRLRCRLHHRCFTQTAIKLLCHSRRRAVHHTHGRNLRAQGNGGERKSFFRWRCHALPWIFKELKIGQLVGKRIGGGLIGNTGFVPQLIDGGSVTALTWPSTICGASGTWKTTACNPELK